MRREKTLKVCANHLGEPQEEEDEKECSMTRLSVSLYVVVVPGPKLEPNGGSDRAWVWTCLGDISDLDEGEEPKPELLAIRFANSDGTHLSCSPLFSFHSFVVNC